MSNQIEIHDPEEAAAAAELDEVKMFGVKIAEQNALVLDAVKVSTEANAATQEAIKAMTMALADVKGVIADAVTAAVAGLNITVNVPEQPAPVVNVTMPEQAPAGKKKFKLTPKRDKGIVVSYDGSVE